MKNKIEKPLVSIIMTAYNTERYIDMALESIMNQSYPNQEIIIVDDGSTDTTWEKILYFKKKDKRIKAYRLRKNRGPSAASNFALKRAKGKYIARLDADDIAYHHRIAKQVAFMELHPEVVMLGGQSTIIDEQNNCIGKKRFPLSHEEIYRAMFMINPVQHPSCMFRKSVFRKAHIRYEKKYFISHDLKILFELLAYGKFANLPDTLIKYRYRPNSITHRNPKRTFKETLAIRYWAWKKGIYNPTKLAILIHFLESILVAILPNYYINILFQFWRISKIREKTARVTQQVKVGLRYAMSLLS